MEIYQLRAFVTVARLGHLTKAADSLHLTQPAVSAQIKALEQELGIALFDRKHGRIAPTRAAELLLPDAEKTLATVSAFLARARQIRGEVSGRVCLGILADPEFLRLGGVLSAAVHTLPLVEIKTRTLLAEDILEGIRSGSLAAGFYVGTVSDAELNSLVLRTVRYRIAGAVVHAEELSRAGWKRIASLPWVGVPERSHLHGLQRELFNRQGLEPNVVVETDDVHSLYNLVRSGVGLGLIREDVAIPAAARGELVVWGHAQVHADLTFVYPAHAENDPAVVGLTSVIQHAWGLAT